MVDEDEVVRLPPLLQVLLEVIARQLDAGEGRWRLEFEFDSGRLRKSFRHQEHIGVEGLRRFEHDPAG